MSTDPPAPGPPQIPPAGTLRCPRCSAAVGPEQDWCVECGAPARTRLAPTPNWQLPTVALGAVILVASALFAFAFVKLTNDDHVTTTPAAITTAVPAVAPPAVVAPVLPAPVIPPAPTATTQPTTPKTTTGTAPSTTGTTPATTATTGSQPTATKTTP